ncbi:MAG TPA: hypothetical protein VJJ98_02205 [Sedimentisphaerales bacterium]|nr:hypothetical protein [Sedimentisphaerales bacterium]
MPIVDGQYQEQISTVFKTNKEAIEQIKAMHYAKCVKCMKGMFEMAWRYSGKQK